MPCFAVATAKATVANNIIKELMSKDLIEAIARKVSEETGIELRRIRQYNDPNWGDPNWIVDCFLPDGNTVGVAYLPNGGIGVSIQENHKTEKAKAYREALETKIGAVLNALLGRKIETLLQEKGAQNIQTSFKNNATVLRFKA